MLLAHLHAYQAYSHHKYHQRYHLYHCKLQTDLQLLHEGHDRWCISPEALLPYCQAQQGLIVIATIVLWFVSIISGSDVVLLLLWSVVY